MSATAAKPFAARAEDARRAAAPRRHGDVSVAQPLLEHRDRRPWIALQALGDGDSGRVADLRAAKFETDRVLVDEQAAIGLIVHGRLGGRLGVAARGEAEADDQRGNRGSEQ